MPTALQMITRAMRLNGDYEVGQTLSAEDASDGLYALNEMMESFNLQRLMIYNIIDEDFPLVEGQRSYTIGSGADFDTDRPISLENSCYIENAGIRYPVKIVNQPAIVGIPVPGVTTMPSWVYYDTAYPTGTITFDCEPYAGLTFHLCSRKILQQFTDLTTSLSLPQGYQGVIEFTLAERLAPEYGHEAPPSVRQQAANYRRWLKTQNAPNGVLQTEVGVMNTSYVWNIYAG